MDGKGRWVDNVFVERLWRSLKYEEVYLKAYDTVAEARLGIGNYFRFYNRERRHQSLERQTPDQVYEGRVMWPIAA
jgi:putative transposase